MGEAYQSDEDHPGCKHEHGENSRDECRRRLLRRAESVFDGRLGVVMDFFRVWYNRLRSRDYEIEEVNGEGFMYERPNDQ